MKNRILKLVNSIEFQELNSYYNEKTLFSALNVERNENRHSAFVAWWLNPKSEHGLGDLPLKLFLRLVATKSLGESTFGIDGFDGAFYSRVLAGNYNIALLEDIEVEKNVGKICNNNS
ncbi:MAG: PD-(D/E)XK nuclease family protein, partial [Mediterraneibacter faecis]|nr:PD-(D/E)XK nuclease family protein [Mediterraneibacter faecis]